MLFAFSWYAHYAPPISYNFLNLIRLDGNAKTTFEKRMGNIDHAVPFFGQGFNRIYPLFMIWKWGWRCWWVWLIWHNYSEKEHQWLQQGLVVGENIVPLARNFNNWCEDIEADNIPKKSTWNVDDVGSKTEMEMKTSTTSLITSNQDGKGSRSKILKDDHQVYGSKGAITAKYAPLRETSEQAFVSFHQDRCNLTNQM